MTILPATPHSIRQAAEILRGGDLVVLPTETVYGLSANAMDSNAVAKIYALKSRPSFNPLIVHGQSLDHLEQIAEFNDLARNLATHFWAGALTFILPIKRNSGISDLVTAGLDTVAVRVPSHPVFQAVLKESNLYIAAPSANKSGEISPTAPHHVKESLGDQCPFLIAGGVSTIGLESTILDLTSSEPLILRYGAITDDDLARVLGAKPRYHHETSGGSIKSPGQLLKHYAPNLPLRLNAIDAQPDEALLAFGSTKFMGIVGGGFAKDLPSGYFLNLSEGGDLTEAAANLFSHLRALDKSNAKGIAVMNIPNTGIGLAINDRLFKAAKGK